MGRGEQSEDPAYGAAPQAVWKAYAAAKRTNDTKRVHHSAVEVFRGTFHWLLCTSTQGAKGANM